jgi:hypothetical protein
MAGAHLEPLASKDDAVHGELDPLDGAPGAQIGTCLARHSFQLGRHRAHAPDGNAPLTGAVAEAMEEEAAVLHERPVVQRGERTDQPVGAHQSAHEIVREATLECDAQRLLDDVRPGHHLDHVAQVAHVGEWLEEGRGQGAGQGLDVGIELLPRLVLGVGTGQLAEGPASRLPVVGLDEQASVVVRRVGGRGPRAQLQLEAEVVDQCVGHEAHEVGEARQASVESVERARAHRRSAEVVEALEHHDVETRARQVGGGYEGVVSAPDDHDIVVSRHTPGGLDARPTRRWPRGRCSPRGR